METLYRAVSAVAGRGEAGHPGSGLRSVLSAIAVPAKAEGLPEEGRLRLASASQGDSGYNKCEPTQPPAGA